VGDKLTVAPFSNIDPTLSAPGCDIVSALRGGGLAAGTGTSMACPHVAGAAVLWWEHLRKLGSTTAETVVARMTNAVRLDQFAPGLGNIERGAGLAQAPPKSG
jgi:subtilisin family serine protease